MRVRGKASLLGFVLAALVLISGCSVLHTSAQQRAQQQFESNRARYDAAAKSVIATDVPASSGHVDLPAAYSDLTAQGGVDVRVANGATAVVFNLADHDPDYFVGYIYAPGFDTLPTAVVGDGGSVSRIDGEWWAGLVR